MYRAIHIQVNYGFEKLAILSSTRPFLYGYVTEADCNKKILQLAVQSVPESSDTRP